MVGVIPMKRPRANPRAISLGLPLIFRNLSYARLSEEFKLPRFACCLFILVLPIEVLMMTELEQRKVIETHRPITIVLFRMSIDMSPWTIRGERPSRLFWESNGTGCISPAE